MCYFDLHVHPSMKGGLSTDPVKYNAWEEFPLLNDFGGLIKYFKQIINSQASLTRLQYSGVVTVASFLAVEQAFAKNAILYWILAYPKVSPLSRKKLRKIRLDRKTYHHGFKRDLQHLMDAKKYGEFKIIKSHECIERGKLNVLLSVEGAHNFQDVKINSTVEEKHESIVATLLKYKSDTTYRFHHLTLTHLTRQPACVHCFGVKVKRVFNLFPEQDFQPDPKACGISPLGWDVIKTCFDTSTGPRILIDIKHMSLVSRKQFYETRASMWPDVPIIASHMGVTGTTYADAKIIEIKKGQDGETCDEVFWCSKKGLCNTTFNPWTIGLYDEEIIEILKSNGMIGISLEQRILGQGDVFGEYMSGREVAVLELEKQITGDCGQGYEKIYLTDGNQVIDESFINDDGVRKVLDRQGIVDLNSFVKTRRGEFNAEMIFPFDEAGKNVSGASHIDFLANNILHVLKVGLKNGYDGISKETDVRKSICIGSDLDGIADALNFPLVKGDRTVDENNWVEANEYERLKDELVISIERLKGKDPYLNEVITNPDALVNDFMYGNGMAFLKKYFN